MEMRYKDKKLKKFLENNEQVAKKHGKEISNAFIKTKKRLIIANDLLAAIHMYSGMKIKKLKGKRKIWALRLNKKYRLEFETEKLELQKIKEIIITKIQPHKYKM